jgi:hypothetical protein
MDTPQTWPGPPLHRWGVKRTRFYVFEYLTETFHSGISNCNSLDSKTLTLTHRALSPAAVRPWWLVELMCTR